MLDKPRYRAVEVTGDSATATVSEELHFGTTLADTEKSKSLVWMRGYVGTPNEPLPIEPQAPAAWLINRLAVDAEGEPLQQGIFSNYNDDILLEADSNTIIGRYSPARGPAESLIIGDGLRVEDGVLIGEGGGEKGDPGPPGPPGPQGPIGPGGASSSAFDYRADTQVQSTSTDPGAGKFRWNNVVQTSATMLSIDRMTLDNFDPTAMFKAATFHDEIVIQEKTLAAHYMKYLMTGPAVSMGGGDWFVVPVEYASQGGASFANNTVCSILVRTRGEQGPVGPQGPQGIKGDQGSMGPPGPQGPVGGMGPVGPQGLKGDQGNQGPQGVAGPQGIKGDTGNTGLQGPQGVKGDKGDKGDQGIQGPVGPQGEQGPIGEGLLEEAPADGNMYARQNEAWVEVEAGGASVSISDTPPVAEKAGDLWYNSATGFVFVWIDDGSSQQWVITNPVVPVAGPVGPEGPEGPVGPPGTSASVNTLDDPPASPGNGDLWWESDSGRIHIRFQNAWVQAAASTADADQSRLVSKLGDTMTGPLTLSGNPTLPLHAVPMQYAAPLDALSYNGLQVNGAFEVSQENSNTQVVVQNTTKYILDQWAVSSQHATGIMRCQQSTGAWLTGGNVLTMTCSPEFATLAAGDFVTPYQPIEGYRWSKLCWGSINAMPVTIAFWITSNVSGTASLCIQNGDTTRSYNVPFTVTANVWEYKTITIPGCTDGTWNKTTGIGAYVDFVFAVGSSYRSSANTWLTGAAGGSVMGSSANTNFYAAANNYVTMSNVAIFPGSVAPSAARSPYILRPFDQEIITCCRFWEKLYGDIGSGHCYATTGAYIHIDFQPKRVAPVIGHVNVTDLRLFGPSGTGIAVTAFGGTANASLVSSLVYYNVASGLVLGDGTELFATAASGITLSARL